MQELFNNAMEFFSHPTVQGTGTTVAAILMSLVIKKFGSNTKSVNKLEKFVGNVFDKTKNIEVENKNAAEVLQDVIKREHDIDIQNRKLDAKMDILLDIIKTFIKGTKINVDDKIEIAKIFDQLKKIDYDEVKETVEETSDAVEEFSEKAKEDEKDKYEELGVLLKNLQGDDDDEETSSS